MCVCKCLSLPPGGNTTTTYSLWRGPHQGGDEAAIQLPHDGQEPDDVLLDDADALPGDVHQEGVGGRLDGVGVPLLVVLGLDEGLLAILVDERVEVHRLARPVDLVALLRVIKINTF